MLKMIRSLLVLILAFSIAGCSFGLSGDDGINIFGNETDSSITIGLDGSVVRGILADTGNATGSGQWISFLGSGNATTIGNGSTITIYNADGGLAGAPGPAGADGADGVDGADGADGAEGADGAPGPPGPPGLAGGNGTDGIDGLDGADGAPGPPGAPGLAGGNGTDGIDGLDGADGADGADGLIGNITTDSGNITAPTVLGFHAQGGLTVSGDDDTDIVTVSAPEPFMFPTWQLSTLGGNLTWSGQVVIGEAGGNLTIGQVVYFKSDAHWYLAKADAIGTTEGILGISTATIALGSTGLILLFGFIEYDTWNWTCAAPLFISAATAGLETETKPSTTTQFVRRVGYAYSPDIVLFYPDGTVIGL